MPTLRQTIMLVLDVERKGGRLLARDEATLVLANTDFAAHASLALIAEQHPHTEITVANSAASSSGYIICFTDRPPRPVYQSAAFIQVALTAVCIISAAWHWARVALAAGSSSG